MIRNESTSNLIASKIGDRDELLELASSLMDRFIEDIIPAIAGAVENSILPPGVIELAITSELCRRATKEHFKKRVDDHEAFTIWCEGKGNQEELGAIIDKLKEPRK